jgi:Mg-chelatase subunit ChlD
MPDQIEENERLLAPEMVEKLVRHFGERANVRVLIDYTPGAVPWASPDGVVSIPAWMRADQIKPLLGAILHETGHIEYDMTDNKALIASGMHRNPIYYLFYNVVLDARLDRRRLAEYPGALAMYDAVWRQEQVNARLQSYQGLARATGILKVALAKAVGMEHALAPELLKTVRVNGKEGLVDRLAAILERAESRSGKKSVEDLVAEVIRELVNDGPWKPEMGCVPWETFIVQLHGLKNFEQKKADETLAAARKGIEAFCTVGKGAAKKLVGNAEYGKAMEAAVAWITGTPLPQGSGGQQQQQQPAGGGINPMEEAAYKPPEEETVKRAIKTFFNEAVSAFVSAVEDVPIPDEFAYTVDHRELAKVYTEPELVMLGDRVEEVASAVVDIIVDVSGSMYDQQNADAKIRRAMEAARLWVRTVKDVGARHVKIGFVPFASVAKRNLEFTNVLDVPNEKFTLRSIKGVDLGGGTYLEAAVKISQAALRGVYAKRKAIIVISDGEVTTEAVNRCRKLLRSDIRLAVLTVVQKNVQDEHIADLVSTDVFNYVARSREATETAFAKALLDACARGYDD